MSVKSFSLRYKVMLLLTIVPLLLLASYLFLVIGIFKSDKEAYIYDTNSSVNRSIAAQTRGAMIAVLSSVKPVMQEYFTNGEFGVLSREIFRGDSNLVFMAAVKEDAGNLSLSLDQHLEKSQDDFNDIIKSMTNLQKLLIETKLQKRVVRTPFNNSNILLIETIENPMDKSIVRFLIVIQIQELTDLFIASPKQRFFLGTNSGEFLFRSNLGKNIVADNNNPASQVLDSSFFRDIGSKRASEQTEGTAKISRGKRTYLASYNKIGFGNLIIASVVDQERAFSAVQILVTKSLLFAGLLLSVTVLFSILGSQSITKTLRDLMLAAQRISAGDFTKKVLVKSNDEIGSLAESFNLMSKEVSRLLNETAEKARMASELQTAKTVQETLFPPNLKTFENIEIAGHYEPASECGGDWWYYTKTENKLILCIGDATGHGAPAALITSAARSASSVLESFELEPQQIMRLLNKAIYDVSKGQVMMTFFLAVIDLTDSTLHYCNASHEPPFLVRGGVKQPKKRDLIPLLEVNNARLGQSPNSNYDQYQMPIEPDDFLFFYTDGIADIKNPDGAALGEREFIRIILKSLADRETPATVVQDMNQLISDYRHETSLIDDVTFFCVKYGRRAS